VAGPDGKNRHCIGPGHEDGKYSLLVYRRSGALTSSSPRPAARPVRAALARV